MLIIFGTSVFKTSSLPHLQILLMAARTSASTMGDSPGYQGLPLMGKISDDYQVHSFLQAVGSLEEIMPLLLFED